MKFSANSNAEKLRRKTYLQRRSGGGLENFPYTFLAFGRAFKIGKCIDLFCHGPAVLGLHRILLHFGEFFNGIRIATQVLKKQIKFESNS